MATTRSTYNANAEQFLDAVNQINELNKAYKDAVGHERELLDLSKQLQNSLRNINESMVLRNNDSRTSVTIEKELKNLRESLKKDEDQTYKLHVKITEELNKQRKLRQDTNNIINFANTQNKSAQDALTASLDKIIDLEAIRSTLRTNLVEANLTNNDSLADRLKIFLQENAIDLEKERRQAKGFKDNVKYYEDILKKQEKEKELINEKIKNLNLAQIYNNNNRRNLQNEIELQEQLLSITQAREKINKAKDFFKSNWGAFLGLLGLKNLIETLFTADKQVIDLAENLGISRKTAQNIRAEFLGFVTTIKDGSLSVKDMFEAQSNLTKELGLSVIYSNQELKTFNDLTKLIGISTQSAAKLNILAASTNIEYEKYVQYALEGAFQNESLLKIQMSSKDILEEIGKLSSSILIKFQNNPIALGKAIIQAKALGSSLEQVDKIGESLLNWESSIQSTLQAELLTGRQLNLERARAAALTGNQADLMNEIKSQVGSLGDFMKLNIIAQKSLAEAFGLSKDELAEMLMKQDLVQKYGEKAKDLTSQQLKEYQKSGKSLGQFLEDQSKQLELQQKLNNSIDKMKQMFVILAQGPFGTLVNMMVSLLNNTTALKITFGIITGIIAGNLVSGLFEAVKAMRALLAVTEAQSIASIIGSATLTGGIATIAGLVAAGGAIAYMNNQIDNTQRVNDGIALSNKGPFKITDRYGATAITAKGDNIAVSPNINKITAKGDNIAVSPNINKNDSNQILERKLDELIFLTKQQLNVSKSGNIIKINEFIPFNLLTMLMSIKPSL